MPPAKRNLIEDVFLQENESCVVSHTALYRHKHLIFDPILFEKDITVVRLTVMMHASACN